MIARMVQRIAEEDDILRAVCHRQQLTSKPLARRMRDDVEAMDLVRAAEALA